MYLSKKLVIKMKKSIRVILIGVLCICAILGFFLIAKLSHPKTIEDKIIEKCSNAADINISMSDITDFEWDKCIVYNVPLVKTQMKKIIVTAKTLYSHPKNVSKIYAALHTDLAW